MEALEAFGRAWRDLEPAEAELAGRLCVGEQARDGASEPRVETAVERFQQCLKAKDRLEEGLQPFLVRSVRTRHHHESYGVRDVPDASRIPVALVDRLIAERLEARRRVMVASALTSACSSWEALFQASITEDDDHQRETLRALGEMRAQELLGPHPKVRSTVDA